MASSSVFNGYVELGYVEDEYFVKTQELTVELNTQEETVSGVAERIVTATGTVQTQPTDITGIGKKKLIISSVLQTQNPSLSGFADRLLFSRFIPLTKKYIVRKKEVELISVKKEKTRIILSKTGLVDT